MIDHVTYQVEAGHLHDDEIAQFMHLLGLAEMNPSADILEKGWNVRWFRDGQGFQVHLVEGPVCPPPSLSHFCVRLRAGFYELCQVSPWLERDSGSGRIWLHGPQHIRVEVRTYDS